MGFNNKNFVYTGSGFDNMKVTKFRRKRRQDNLETGRFNDDFVSRYAITRRMRMKEIRQLKNPAALEQSRVLPPGSDLLVQPEKSRAPAGFHSMAAGRTGQTPSRRDPGIDRRPFLVVAPVQRFLRSGRKIMTGNMSFRGKRYS